MQDDVAKIAASLTKAQRQTLLGCKSKGSTKPLLMEMGLLELIPRHQKPWAKSPRFDYLETPLGLAVRAHLETTNG